MPDLDIVYHQVCTETQRTEKVKSSSGRGIYEVTASLDEKGESCTCKGFEFRRHCRHIDEVRSRICGWDEQYSPETQTPQQEMEAVCPKCGADTQTIRRGV